MTTDCGDARAELWFDGGEDEATLDEVVGWLEARGAPFALRVHAGLPCSGHALVFQVVLPRGRAVEAVWLSLSPGCLGARPEAMPASEQAYSFA